MIRLPRKHIADSVTDRIMQMIDRTSAANNVALQGQKLAEALAQPAGDIAPVEGIEDALVGKALDL